MPLKLNSAGGGSVTIDTLSTASNFNQTVPAANGTVVVSTAVSASTANTVTNKIAININGTIYYVLASTSGV